MTYRLITDAATEPVSATEAKLHCKVDDTADDTLFTILIKAARQLAEQYTRRAFVSQVWELVLDSFDKTEYDLKSPVISPITSVKYIDANGVEQTLASTNYQLNTGCEPNTISLSYNGSWPTVRGDREGIKIRFSCGYTTLPAPIKQAMLLIIGHLYENREDVISGKTITAIPKGSEYLLDPYRLWP